MRYIQTGLLLPEMLTNRFFVKVVEVNYLIWYNQAWFNAVGLHKIDVVIIVFGTVYSSLIELLSGQWRAKPDCTLVIAERWRHFVFELIFTQLHRIDRLKSWMLFTIGYLERMVEMLLIAYIHIPAQMAERPRTVNLAVGKPQLQAENDEYFYAGIDDGNCSNDGPESK